MFARARPDINEKILAAGMETGGTAPDQFAAIIKTDVGRWGKVFKEAGITLEQQGCSLRMLQGASQGLPVAPVLCHSQQGHDARSGVSWGQG